MSGKIKILSISLVTFLFLFFPSGSAKAFIGTGVFDYFTAALEGIEEFSEFSTKLFLIISLLLLITYIALGVSSYLLQWIISVPINLDNSLVLSGWTFTLGLANTFFILIFIIIALAYILKIGAIAQKRVLTNLILIALLINFSLLLVKAVVDLSTFFYNTILRGQTNLLNLTMENLMGGLGGIITTLATWLVGFVMLYFIPFTAPFAQLTVTLRTIATAAMLGVFGPTLMSWILTILFGLGLAGIFFLYFFFFAVRIYIIWALAIFAPLAFICLILPQTKKWWDEWLKHLLEWIFLGLLLLFWLVLGLNLMKYILPLGGPTIAPIVGWIRLGEHIQYFLFLFIYLIIGLYISNKTKPALADIITKFGDQIGRAILGRVITPGAKATFRSLRKMAVIQKRKEKEREEKIKRGEKLPGWERYFYRPTGRAFSWVVRRIEEARGIKPEEVLVKDIERKAEDFEKRFGKDVEAALSYHPFGRLIPEEKVAFGLYLAKVKGGKGLEKLSEEERRELVRSLATYSPARLEDVVKHRPELIEDAKVGEIIQRTMVPEGLEDKDVKKLIEIGVSAAEAIKKAAFKKAVDAIKVADIENLAPETLEHEGFKEMVVRFKPWSFIRALGEERGLDYMEKLQIKAEEIGVEEIDKTNPSLIRAPYTPAGRLILRPWKKKP